MEVSAGALDGKKKVHLVNWDVITRLKEHKGLLLVKCSKGNHL